MQNVMASATEAELGGLIEKFQKATSMRTALSEMSHPQPPTLAAMDNLAANRIMNGTSKQKKYIAIDIIFYWVRDQFRKNHFHILGGRSEKYGRLLHKTSSNLAPHNYATNNIETYKKYLEN